MAKNNNNNDDIDIYELLNRADELLEERENQDPADDFTPEFEESMRIDDTAVYRNAANGYGRNIPQPRQAPAPRPMTQAEQAASSIRAYNADFRNERERHPKAQNPTYDETA